MLTVVRLLNLAAAVRLINRHAHRIRNLIGVHVHLTGHVTRRTTNRLNQRSGRTQEAFLIGIQNRNQGHLGQVQALTQQVNTNQHVEGAQAQFAQKLHTAQGINVRVQVLHLHAVLQQVLGQILRHALSEGRDQHTLITLNAHANLLEQIINLPLGRLDHNLRVNQAGRANNLLHITISLRQLILTGGRRKVNRLTDTLQELLPLQRAVIHRRRQTETVLHQGALTGHVALIHGTNLRDRHVRLINNQQEIIWEIIQQTVRGATGGTTVNMARVVLNAIAEAHLLHHFQVVSGAHAQTLRLQQLALGFEGLQALAQLILNGGNSLRHALRASNVVACGEDIHFFFLANYLAGQRVQGVNRLNLITEELNADRVLLVHGDDFDGIAAHTERAAVKVHVVTRVLHRHEPAQQLVAVNLLTATQSHHLLNVLLGRAQTVNAGYGRNHHHVAAGQQGVRRRVAQALHLLVDGGVLLNERIGLRHVRLRLVVVVVGDEILHRIIRQQFAQLIR